MAAPFLSPVPRTPTPRASAASAASAGGQDPAVPSIPIIFSPSGDDGQELCRRLRGFNAQVTEAISGLSDRTDVLAQRVIAAETARRSLSDGSQSVLTRMITEARTQFDMLRGTAFQHQAAIVQEAAGVRQGFTDAQQKWPPLVAEAYAQRGPGSRGTNPKAQRLR